jgi:hypothetical protein
MQQDQYFENSLHEIGQEMGNVSRQAVQKTLRRALKKFRAAYLNLFECPFLYDNGICFGKVDTEAKFMIQHPDEKDEEDYEEI